MNKWLPNNCKYLFRHSVASALSLEQHATKRKTIFIFCVCDKFSCFFFFIFFFKADKTTLCHFGRLLIDIDYLCVAIKELTLWVLVLNRAPVTPNSYKYLLLGPSGGTCPLAGFNNFYQGRPFSLTLLEMFIE